MHKFIPNKFYFINSFKKKYIDKLDNNTAIIYRNYNKKVNLKEIIKIKDYCLKKKIKFIISNNFRLSLRLNLDGAYIPSFNSSFTHLSYKIKTNFLVLGSAHNIKEIRQKEKQGVDFIFISSIFKNNKNYLGVNNPQQPVTALFKSQKNTVMEINRMYTQGVLVQFKQNKI